MWERDCDPPYCKRGQWSVYISKSYWWSRTSESQAKSGSTLVSGSGMQLWPTETRSRWSPDLTGDIVRWEWPCLSEQCRRWVGCKSPVSHWAVSERIGAEYKCSAAGLESSPQKVLWETWCRWKKIKSMFPVSFQEREHIALDLRMWL